MEHEARTRVDRPVTVVYDQWTQFESFPDFMEGVRDVQQLDHSTTAWDVEIAGVERRFTADILDQQRDRLIRWRSRTDPVHEGRVTFGTAEDGRTEVALWMDFQPDGVVEQLGDKLGFVKARVEGDLERFKRYMENPESFYDESETAGSRRGSLQRDDNLLGGYR
jgi:uncharacterized membrane protein